ncbi:sensor histidine kinase [Geomesophilobacter sediminis]|uniref:histidine kinase n=1 Tax=Geomesophilobacter sediminis TaxID=2798584 RepID=A0A8J7IZA6_9BACT|nr:ATP-binding protein [Geomesophilobacter sediminis]MBJ6723388.1 hypothetical protein [Geomesophilobacter sediminis]
MSSTLKQHGIRPGGMVPPPGPAEKTRAGDECRRLADALAAERTERQRAQRELREKELLLLQQSRLASMGEMVANIAHQWRQPLNILGLLAQDLQMTYSRGELDEGYVKEYVRRTMETIAHMSRTVDDFRAFFVPERDEVEFPVREVVERTLSLLEGSLRARQVRVEVVAQAEPVLRGHPNEFGQVLVNLLNNARDAFPPTRGDSAAVIRIEIGMSGGRVTVAVTDNAGGIPEEILGRIFDPYFTTKSPEEGTGVGLYICKMIVEGKMNGKLTAQNVAGGACFNIEL